MSIDGFETPVTVPSPFDWQPETLQTLTETGVLDARWTPSDDGAMVWIDLLLFHSEERQDQVFCVVQDDGRAVVDLGFAPNEVRDLELSIGRATHAVVDHPELGVLDVKVQRHIRAVVLGLNP